MSREIRRFSPKGGPYEKKSVPTNRRPAVHHDRRSTRLSPGEKLPSEVELARELGVSRTTLREAPCPGLPKSLEARRGRGTFVTDQAAQVNDYGFSHLDQVRGELKDLFELRATSP